MPIFTKNDQRIYFAHIPKTAGTSIYLLFVRNGWAVSNLSPADYPGSTSEMLKSECGITHIPKEGRRWGYRGSLQHAPARVWQRWQRCDESFSIVRQPEERFVSALRYRHQVFHGDLSWEAFLEHLRKTLYTSWQMERLYDGHFRPQVQFITPATRILKFEEDWGAKLCEWYDLNPSDLKVTNQSKKSKISLSAEDRAWITRRYKADFRRFGYEMAPAG